MSSGGADRVRRVKRNQFGLSLVLAGLVMAGGLALPLYLGAFFGEEADRIEALTPVGMGELSRRAVGETVLVEGHLSPRNPAQFRAFVAYVRLEYRGERGGKSRGSIWVQDELVTPPLLVAAPDGVVRVANTTYSMQRETMALADGPVIWQDTLGLVYDRDKRVGTRRYIGYENGSPVLALGVVAAGAEGRVLTAEWLYGGSRADYIARHRQALRQLEMIGLGCLAAGAAIFSFIILQWRRGQASRS